MLRHLRRGVAGPGPLLPDLSEGWRAQAAQEGANFGQLRTILQLLDRQRLLQDCSRFSPLIQLHEALRIL